MESYVFTCQLCRARLTLVGSLEAAPGTESSAWAGGRGLLVPPHLHASVFDHSNVDESFIVLDGKRQGPGGAPPGHGLPPGHMGGPTGAGGGPQPTHPGPGPGPAHPHPPHGGPGPHGHPSQRGMEESFVVLGPAPALRPPGPGHGMSPLQRELLQQQLQQQSTQQPPTQQPPGGAGPSGAAGAGQAGPASPSGAAGPSSQPPLPPQPLSPSGAGPGPGSGATAQALPPPPSVHSSPSAGPAGRGGGGGGGGGLDADGVGGPAGSGLDSKLQALAQLFELAATTTQVDHPLCMDCVGQLKEEMEAQISEAEREIAAYTACLAQLEGGTFGLTPAEAAAAGAAGAGSRGASEEQRLEELSRLEQERDQERARAEALEADLLAVASELSSLAAASADLDSLEERYWHDANDFELLLRAHTDERGGLLARIDRAGQRLQLLRNTSVLYDAFKIWHDGPFGTISGFRLGRTPEVPVEWDEVNAAWGQAVLLLHTMAQMCRLQFSQYRLLPMGSHPRVADKRSSYDLFGPVSKLWSANYDRAMVAFLACLKEFGEHARRKDAADGKPTPFSYPFPIDGDKVNNHTIKLTLNKDARWTKALKFMLANLKIALQWCVKQDSQPEVPALQQLGQEGPQLLPEH